MEAKQSVTVLRHSLTTRSSERFKASTFISRNSRKVTQLRVLSRFRWLSFVAVFCFAATTAFSTTFPLKPSNRKTNINSNGLPSKQKSLTEGGSQVLDDIDNNVQTEISKPIATCATDLILPLEPQKKSEDIDKDKAPLNDTQDDKNGEKMGTVDDQKFKERIQSSIRTVQNWENVEWLKECRDVIPWDDLRNSTGPYSRSEHDRLLADDSNALFLQRLCRWFPKFMTWVNAPPCVKCGCKECEMKTVRGPETEEEKEGNAKRVEVYYCPECNENTTTFPRYNKARKLMDTRQGRCGEYSNLFGLFCRAVGFETRLILDLSDHLWTEVRLGDNWIMADACEGIIDKPSMYEYGWGKDGLCYMIAIASDHVADVTPRYTRKFITAEFQTRRRTHTTSENATMHILRELNQDLRQNLTKSAAEEIDSRRRLEDAELHILKQSTEWTPQDKYGRGRISGSLGWKLSRQEAGMSNIGNVAESEEKEKHVAGFEVESFSPPIESKLSLEVRPRPVGRHDGIKVAGAACAIGEAESVSVVVVDEKFLGCVLQSRSFVRWSDVNNFVALLPPHRIVLMNGKCEEDSNQKALDMPRLGGWKKDDVLKKGIAFIGQVDALPNWAYCSNLEDCPSHGYEVQLKLKVDPQRTLMKLRTERYTYPSKVAGRLPETVMPLKTQLLATEEQKRLAFSSFIQSASGRYSGYTTKPGAPVYLLDSSSYPFSRIDATTLDVIRKENAWNTFHLLPPPLVPSDDRGVVSASNISGVPVYAVPVETEFFNKSLGPQLLKNSTSLLPTSDALHNARLIGIYFSAHWCGPCRQFTPLLAEMYAHLKDHRPSHGLEIVFVSSDRDANSFQHYFGTMPWQAIPYDQLQIVKSALNITYGVRGIPAFVVLDAVSGQVVVPASESRQAVAMACRGGEQQIEALLDAWLQNIPQESKEILSILELSCQEEKEGAGSTSTDPKENPYLVAEQRAATPFDTAGRIKELFEKIVATGNDPTSAAAKAIGLVADEQKKGRVLNGGPLDGQDIRTGPVASISGAGTLDEALILASKCSPSLLIEAMTTARKYLQNATKEPWSPRFRHFNLSNKVVDLITRVDGGLALLQGLGFEVYETSRDFKATIPVSVDLEDLDQKLSRLIQEASKGGESR